MMETISWTIAITAMLAGFYKTWRVSRHTNCWHNPGLSVRDQVELEMLGGSHNPRCRNLDCAGCQ